jgi:hypothetical protein
MILEVAAATVAMFLEMVSTACQSAGVADQTLAIQVILSWILLVSAFYSIAFGFQVINQFLLILGRACNAFLRRRSPRLGRMLDAWGTLVKPATPTEATT